MIKAAIFDMDGTLFDTERIYRDGWLSAGSKMNFEINEGILCNFRGVGVNESRRRFKEIYGQDFPYDEARQIRTDYAHEYMDTHGVPMKKGTMEILEYLKSQGIKIALATSTASKTAESMMQSAGIRDYFEVIIGGDMVSKSKPNPEIFLKAVKAVNAQPSESIVFEDSRAGVQAGFDGGFYVIAVEDLTPLLEESRNMATAVCEDLEAAIEVVKKLS